MLTKEGDKYYYKDNKGIEWEFREKNGSIDNYYFVCSTSKYKKYSIISRKDKNKIFRLTKGYSIPYI